MRTNRTKKAVEYLMNNHGVDYVLETHTTPDFVECVCIMGGDTATFRVYDRNDDFFATVR